ncbi:MAG: isoprenyl transferase [Pseudomonadota bacterium]
MNEPARLPGVTNPQGPSLEVPRHVAIIMDGNGRWANARGLPRTAGHERGVEALRRTVEGARDLGIEYLTVFSFSTENWRRPLAEVDVLFGLLRAYVRRDLDRLTREGVRVRVIGNRAGVPQDIADLIERAEDRTIQNTRAHLTIAFNYGGRDEIVRMMRKIAEAVKAGQVSPTDIDDTVIERWLDTAGLPDPDLLIRTSGEMRISNFLLWQVAYAEIEIMDVLWPDFDKSHLEQAIAAFRRRERRFGNVSHGAV